MTGIGIAGDFYKDINVNIEVKSVNHRYCDISFRIPRFLSILEKDFREIIRNKIKRGKIFVLIEFENSGNLFSDILIDLELANKYFDNLKTICENLRIPFEIKAVDFLKMKGVFDLKERSLDNDFKEFILNLVNNAINNLLEMKIEEGKYLENDIFKRLNRLNELILKIDSLKEKILAKYKEKLKNNLDRVFSDNRELINEKRIEFEIIQYSDKTDITEEIVRFNSHIEKFLNTIKLEPPIGKKLDFILQEMNREVNTIASKNVLSEISDMVIELKTEIEKIREQIQNIE